MASVSSSALLGRTGRVGRIAWRAVQGIGLIATLLLIIGLIVRPALALGILWNVLIPLLPASFLITPALWRGVCPLATLNMTTNGLAGRRRLPPAAVRAADLLGILLLALLVPARRFLFNENGPALAGTILAITAAALLLGAFLDAKAGFCNSFCPVLPVEKLYGQHPLLQVGNPRCAGCTLCVPKGCIDLGSTRAAVQALGRGCGSRRWLMTPFGIFAAALPGFVVGYFTTADTSLVFAGAVYQHIGIWACGSYLAVVLVVCGLRLPSPLTLALLAAAAVSLYYWFAAPLMATWLLMAGTGTALLRGGALALVAFWLCHAGVQARSRQAGRDRPAGPFPIAISSSRAGQVRKTGVGG